MQENNYNTRANTNMMFTDFPIKLNKERVFHFIDCYPESPIYEEVVNEYEYLKDEIIPLMEPVAILQLGRLQQSVGAKDYADGTPVCYVILSIGKKAEELSSHYFNTGNYLAGMLVNAMADDYLMQLDQEVGIILRQQCSLWQLGVIKRLEAPKDFPMEGQKVILHETGADSAINLGITEGYMYTTVKTSGFILILTKDKNIFKIQHNCNNCDSLGCKMKVVNHIINSKQITDDFIDT